MVAVPLHKTDPVARIPLSGIVRAKALQDVLQPYRGRPAPRRVALICEADVRVRPLAIGLLYQTLLQWLVDGTDLLVVCSAPLHLESTLRGLIDKVDTDATVCFTDRPEEARVLLQRHALRSLLTEAVPYRTTRPPNLPDLVDEAVAGASVRDAAA